MLGSGGRLSLTLSIFADFSEGGDGVLCSVNVFEIPRLAVLNYRYQMRQRIYQSQPRSLL